MPPTSYGVTITMDAATVESLAASGSFLYALAAVQCSDDAAQPLVWHRTRSYSLSTPLPLTAEYQAYTSTDTGTLSPGTQASPGFSAPIAAGQTLVVNAAGGIGAVLQPGCPGAVSILNTTGTQLTCGVAMKRSDGTFVGVCALPLYGRALQIVQPLPRVLLLFSPRDAPPWTVADIATGPGVLVDLAAGTTRALTFEKNAGWSWGGATWARRVDAESPLKPLLVETTSPLMQQAQQAAVNWGL